MSIIVRRNANVEYLEECGVPDEGHLQRFIFDNPDSLPLSDIKEDGRLMIVGREFATSSGPIDVLAIDGDGDIYIVETKLYKNPDKRRVIAQLLDYGAALWRGYRDSAEFLVAAESAVRQQSGSGLEEFIAKFYELDEQEAGEVIQCLTKNQQDGNFKFVVLMDHLEDRLRNLILFLNQRSQFSIYAVVMQFYRQDDLEIVIPKLYGAEVTKDVSTGPAPRGWNETRFFAAAQGKLSVDGQSTVRRVYDFAR